MTKRLHMSAPASSSASAKARHPGVPWSAFGVLVVCAVAYGIFLGDDAGQRPLSQFAMRLAQDWRATVATAPRLPSLYRGG